MTSVIIFSSSSKESMSFLNKAKFYLAVELGSEYSVKSWKEVFPNGVGTYEAISDEISSSKYGVFIGYDDDSVSLGKGNYKKCIRDNVLFEFGMFCGRKDIQNSFMLKGSGVERYPTDMAGITHIPVDFSLEDSFHEALDKIIHRIKEKDKIAPEVIKQFPLNMPYRKSDIFGPKSLYEVSSFFNNVEVMQFSGKNGIEYIKDHTGRRRDIYLNDVRISTYFSIVTDGGDILFYPRLDDGGSSGGTYVKNNSIDVFGSTAFSDPCIEYKTGINSKAILDSIKIKRTDFIPAVCFESLRLSDLPLRKVNVVMVGYQFVISEKDADRLIEEHKDAKKYILNGESQIIMKNIANIDDIAESCLTGKAMASKKFFVENFESVIACK